MLIGLVIKLETKSFEMKCPLMGACKSSVELEVNVFFHHFNLLSYFFVKKIPFSRRVEYVMDGSTG